MPFVMRDPLASCLASTKVLVQLISLQLCHSSRKLRSKLLERDNNDMNDFANRIELDIS